VLYSILLSLAKLNTACVFTCSAIFVPSSLVAGIPTFGLIVVVPFVLK
jgi:hypothetical protein